jgi:hypothetical protein
LQNAKGGLIQGGDSFLTILRNGDGSSAGGPLRHFAITKASKQNKDARQEQQSSRERTGRMVRR